MFEMKRKTFSFIQGMFVLTCLVILTSCQHIESFRKTREQKNYQQYLDFFEEVYETMDQHYYKPVPRAKYDQFIEKFNTKIYAQLKEKGKSNDFVRWRSASFLIEHLKSEEDIFSEFYPPKPAQKYKQTALGVRKDLGIDGEVVERGYKVTHVEPRADAYAKGLRNDDIILTIDYQEVTALEENNVKDMLTPLMGTTVTIEYLREEEGRTEKIVVEPKEYFKQTVFMCPTQRPGLYCLEIPKFNRKTAEDFYRHLKLFYDSGDIKGLVLDLRGNPGGPPLAAREMSAFFLTAGEDFVYFKRKNQPKAELDVPKMFDKVHYEGPMVILVNKGSGSASELFSGAMQRRERAIVMGVNTAGQVMLKSMFNFSDGTMALLITGRGYHPDGTVFSFSGVEPDRIIKEENIDLIDYAMKYLYYVNIKGLN